MKLRLAVMTATLLAGAGAPLASYADSPSLLNQLVNGGAEIATHMPDATSATQTAPAIPQQMNLTVGSRDFWKDN